LYVYLFQREGNHEEKQLNYACGYMLRGLELELGGIVSAFTASRTHLLVSLGGRLHLFVFRQHSLELVGQYALTEPVLGLAFRNEYVAAVSATGKVTYLTLKLDPVFEFELGRSVQSVAVRNELLFVLSEGHIVACLDQFYCSSTH
jgi:hypothetical protein